MHSDDIKARGTEITEVGVAAQGRFLFLHGVFPRVSGPCCERQSRYTVHRDGRCCLRLVL